MKPHMIGIAAFALTIAAGRAHAGLPMAFERNAGQAGSGVEYVARGHGYGIQFAPDGATLASESGTVRMSWRAANRHPRLHGRGAASGTASYMTGRPEEWRTGIPLYSGVQYDGLYPGIDLVFYGSEGKLEYDFILQPGADPSSIAIRFDGIEDLRLDDGELVLRTAGGELRHHRPRIYQEGSGGKEEVSGEYVLLGPREAGFRVHSYDRARALVIDPVLVYSTYLGGSGDDRAWAIAVDASGCAYVAGETWSANFPRTVQPGLAWGNQDAFVAKLNAAGTGIVYATYFGGSSRDSARGIALDAAGNAYVTGFTYSTNFPTTAGAFRTASAGQEDAFVLKLNATGTAFVYSTILGGPGSDFATGIAVDAGGNAYVSGYTSSVAFPVTATAAQKTFRGGFQDAFAAKLNPTGTALVYATLIGGSGNDLANGIAVDAGGFAYLTGYTESADFPVRNALQAAYGGQGDAFVVKLNPGGDTFAYATYLGGRGMDIANAVAVDVASNVYIAGGTLSNDFPAIAGAVPAVNHGMYDAFLAEMDASGSALLLSTLLGGTGSEQANALALDAGGRVYIAGSTTSANFPSTGAGSSGFYGGRDIFAAAYSGSALSWATCLGGAGDDVGNAMAANPAGAVYITGSTASTDFPVVAGAYNRANRGGTDVFVAELLQDGGPQVVSVSPASGTGSRQAFQFLFSDTHGFKDVGLVELNIGSGSDVGHACYIQYDAVRNLLWLVNDTVTAPLGPVSPGSAGTAQNSQCMLNGAGSSAAGSGSNLTVTVDVTFAFSYAGKKILSAAVRDLSGRSSGWQSRGDFTVLTNRPPLPLSITPAAGSGMTQTFAVSVQDENGHGDISVLQIQIAPAFFTGAACYIQFERARNLLWLVNDTGTAPLGPLVPGTSATAQNSQCILSAAGSSVSGTQNTLSLSIALTFKAAFTGQKYIFAWAMDQSGSSSDWYLMANWLVTPPKNQPPMSLSVSPSGGASSSQSFTFSFSDPDGFTDIDVVQMLINSSFSGGYACYIQYERAANLMWLVNDMVTAPIGPVVPGSGTTAANSQCVLSGAKSSVSGSGPTMTITVDLTFKSSFVGSKTIYAWAKDRSGAGATWETIGKWDVVATPPMAVMPSAGSGSSQLFTFSFAPPGPGTDYDVVQAMLAGDPRGGYACWVQFEKTSRRLWLVNDIVTAPLGPVVPGVAGTVENSQCVIDAGASSISESGAGLVLSVRMTFKPAFVGAKSFYMWSKYTNGAVLDWQIRGTWNVTH